MAGWKVRGLKRWVGNWRGAALERGQSAGGLELREGWSGGFERY